WMHGSPPVRPVTPDHNVWPRYEDSYATVPKPKTLTNPLGKAARMQLSTPRQGYREDLNLALVIADAVDGLTMDRFQAVDLDVTTKPDLKTVSYADSDTEVLNTARLCSSLHADT